MRQETFKEPTEEDLNKLEELNNVQDPFFQNLEKQVASPEGPEGIRTSLEKDKKKMTKEKEMEIVQAFLKGVNKWSESYILSGSISMADLPLYLDSESKIKNDNSFNVAPLFIDYLLANAAENVGSEILREIIGESYEIRFFNILPARAHPKDVLILQLKTEDRTLILRFEDKYPFKLKESNLSFLR